MVFSLNVGLMYIEKNKEADERYQASLKQEKGQFVPLNITHIKLFLACNFLML